MSLSPTIKLNNGKEMPILGLGTWNSPPGEVTTAVKYAIDAGYRHIDGAHIYENEHEVGEGIRAKIDEGVVKREDLFVTTKLWNTFHRPDLVKVALLAQLKTLGLEYLDLYLIHWPMAYKEDGPLQPKDSSENLLFSEVDYLDTWKAMEKLYDEGLVKAIGVSNFNKKQLTRVLENARIKPVTNQIECHPYLHQQKMSDLCHENDVVVTAYSPLCSHHRAWANPKDPEDLLDEPLIKQISAKHNKEAAQVLIRYQMQRGHVVIPKSVTKSRIISNFNVWDFELTPEDIASIETFECNGRLVPMTGAVKHPLHPFINDEY